MHKDGVTLLIDPMSYQYLVGAEIDYQEGLEGAQFVIKNPTRRRRAAADRASPPAQSSVLGADFPHESILNGRWAVSLWVFRFFRS
jgi:hypothetical protein